VTQHISEKNKGGRELPVEARDQGDRILRKKKGTRGGREQSAKRNQRAPRERIADSWVASSVEERGKKTIPYTRERGLAKTQPVTENKTKTMESPFKGKKKKARPRKKKKVTFFAAEAHGRSKKDVRTDLLLEKKRVQP